MIKPATHLARYEPRTIAFQGLYPAVGATLKTYAISRDGGAPRPSVMAAARRLADAYLLAPLAPCAAGGVDWSACTEHGLGSLIVHTGREAAFVLIDCWVGENMLRHHVWAAPLGRPDQFESLAPCDVTMCVWELAVIQHERAAWLRHMLTPGGASDPAAYLADVLNGEV